MTHDRSLIEGEESLFEKIDKQKWVSEREVSLSKRKKANHPRKSKAYPERKSRLAKLSFCSTEVELKRPKNLTIRFPSSLKVSVVFVKELDPPADCAAVEWRLYTLEPIKTESEILRVVDIYRSRWLIEEYFKAIKTGCRYEKRQLESYYSLINALTVFIPIAWRLLLLRSMERLEPTNKAINIMDPQEIDILRAISKKPFPQNPSIAEVLSCIAKLGGHIKNNGPPGWLVLWRGYQKFLAFEAGWKAAMQSTNVINR